MNALICVAFLSFTGPAKAEAAKLQLTGDVVSLADVLAKRKIPHDAEVAATLVLVAADGAVYPLLKNEESRLFFLDTRLQGRPMQVTGNLTVGNLLKVDTVRSLKDGVPHDVYYWCEKCQLRFLHAGICTCCGAVTELWEEPIAATPKKK